MSRTYPVDTAALLALIPSDWHDTKVPWLSDGSTPREAAAHVDESGCMGCRVGLWRVIDAADETTTEGNAE